MSTCFLATGMDASCSFSPPIRSIEDVAGASCLGGGATRFLDGFQKTCAICLIHIPSVGVCLVPRFAGDYVSRPRSECHPYR
jgi:hypothetical protein